jgi:hypothetical protein
MSAPRLEGAQGGVQGGRRGERRRGCGVSATHIQDSLTPA